MMRYGNLLVIVSVLIALMFSFGCSTDEEEGHSVKSEGDVKGETPQPDQFAGKLDTHGLAVGESVALSPDEKDHPTRSERKSSELQQHSRLGYLYHRGKKYPLEVLFGEGKKDLTADEFVSKLDVNKLVADEGAAHTLMVGKEAERNTRLIYASIR